jgi:hypothetical protein
MQERKNKKRFILLVALTLATLIAFWLLQPENRLNVDQDIFQVEDLSAISKVELVSDTSAVSLSFNGSRWRVNEKYNADGSMIRVLFATLQQAAPKRPVTGFRQDSVYNHLLDKGIKVSLYEGDELKKEFFVGGNSAKTQGFFADPFSKEVYVMAVPGYRVYVSGIFELGESGWRDKFVFGFNWRNFKSLEADFLKTPAENFDVTMDRDYLSIEGLPNGDTAKLNTFLDDVSLLTVDEYISEPWLRDSLLNLSPDFQLGVTDIANRTYRLRLYNNPVSETVLGIVHEDQPALFDRKKIQRLLKPKSFFVKK